MELNDLYINLSDPHIKLSDTYIKIVLNHTDDYHVYQFAKKMVDKLKQAREIRGRSGWNSKDANTVSVLQEQMSEHLAKGDPIDVANYCMFLEYHNASTKNVTN